MSEQKTSKIRRVISAIRDNDRFMVATHVHPDGDALGSLLGMKFILERLGKKADIFAQDKIPPEFEFLPQTKAIRNKPIQSAKYDAAILVDCGDFERVGDELAGFISGLPFIINIDHHVPNRPFGNISWVEQSACSTCEMLFDLCMSLSLAPDANLSSVLYTGLITDTGSFRFSNTNRRVLEVAAVLVEMGADPVYLATQIYDSATPEKLKLLAQVLGTLQFHTGARIVTAELSRSMLANSSSSYMDSEGFINHLRSVKSADLAILFREVNDGLIHVSMRSREGIDVAKLAQRYGGGGHKQAAACRISGTLHAVRSMFVGEAVSYMN